ncbi:ACT domain-containing protein [Vibrio breoganii]|uniref:ACT domain-containing protein n=1 Tax=Vibrio breoganii TaxID=553239 RepID=UPI000C84E050|nr:ACT domain-containing protein [Vibrio breoganii]PMK28447.1 transporter [Vibrio breoganii]TKG28588.1 ACT domain-containing protein [Vibrio breoganii]
MSGIKELDQLLKSMKPHLQEEEFVFCTVEGKLSDYIELDPVGTFIEPEGLTLVLERRIAEQTQLSFDGAFRMITLTVHSSLEAVGLTAAVSTKLAEKGISANVIAAYYHDHIFVPAAKAELALQALNEFSK